MLLLSKLIPMRIKSLIDLIILVGENHGDVIACKYKPLFK